MALYGSEENGYWGKVKSLPSQQLLKVQQGLLENAFEALRTEATRCRVRLQGLRNIESVLPLWNAFMAPAARRLAPTDLLSRPPKGRANQ